MGNEMVNEKGILEMEMVNTKLGKKVFKIKTSIESLKEVKEFFNLGNNLYVIINKGLRQNKTKEWVKSNIDMNLDNVVNIKYINGNVNQLEIDYKNKDKIRLIA